MNSFKGQKGFSLIEMIIVSSIVGILATTLILNFRAGSRDTALIQVAQQIASDVREAQSMAISSKRYAGQTRCGYGISFNDAQTYQIYVGPDSKTVDCHSIVEKNFGAGDMVVETVTLLDIQVEITGVFPDIFFEPPDPTTYINNNDLTVSSNPAEIVLTNAGGSTKKVLVYPSGLVEVE